MDKYEKIKLIGEGTYAKVYQARHRHSGQIFALKEMNLNPDEGAPSTALREIAFMKEMKHPNIVKLLEVIHSDRHLVLVFECLQQDLKQFFDLRRSLNTKINEDQVRSFMYQILDGTRYCHENRILHRDLKPQNLLLDSGAENIKIADFGLARGFGIPVPSFSHEVVTLWYRPPDVLLGSTVYGTAIDIWSVGCIMAEFYSNGLPLFPGKNNHDQLKRIFKVLGTPSRETWNDLMPSGHQVPQWVHHISKYDKPPIAQTLATIFPRCDKFSIDLMSRLLDYRPEYRISAVDALHHPYFSTHNTLLKKKNAQLSVEAAPPFSSAVNRMQQQQQAPPQTQL